MAEEPLNDESNDELLLDEEVEQPAPEGQELPEQTNEEDDEETVLTFGDGTEAEEGDTNLVKHLREELKKRDKALADARRTPVAAEPVEVGEKPTLWDDGIEGDEDKYDAAMEGWRERKAAAERGKGEQDKAAERERDAWAAEIERYEAGKNALGFKDMTDAEDTVKVALSPVQQAVIVKAADDSAKVIYALGKHPDRLAQLAGIEDPLKFAAAVARLEGTLKMVKRRKAPEPDRAERGSAPVSRAGVDRTLEKLEAEAERINDRSKVVAYKRELKRKAQQAAK